MSEISDEMVEAYRQAAIRCSASTYSAPYHDDCCPRAGLAAAYPLLRAQIREEAARDIEAAALQRQISASVLFGATDRGVEDMVWVAADGAEQMTVERAEARDEQEG